MKLKIKSPGKTLAVKISTYESELEFDIPVKSTGKYLFDLVCGTIGLRETWYFGLQNYILDTSGEIKLTRWLKLDKKIVAQRHSNKFLRYYFRPKFYPEEIERELIQASTRHLFYLEVKESLMRRGGGVGSGCGSGGETPAGAPPCPPPEVAVLLASLSAQAEYGDLCEGEMQDEEEQMFLPGRLLRLLPARLLLQCQVSQETANCMKACYKRHKGMTRDEAELEYLKVAQMYRLFGVEYFSISDKHNSGSWLGVTASAINIFPADNKFHPQQIFSWNIIKNVSYREKKSTPHTQITNYTHVKLSGNFHSLSMSEISLAAYYFTYYTSPTVLPIMVAIFAPWERYKRTWWTPPSHYMLSTTDFSIHHRQFTIKLNPRGGMSNVPPMHLFGSNSGVSSSLPSTPVTPRIEAPTPQSPMFGVSRDTLGIGGTGNSLFVSGGCVTSNATGGSTSNGGLWSNSIPISSSASGVVDVWLQEAAEAKTVMELCVGNHELFMRRRQPDSIEVQQMKAQAREEKARREAERARLSRARAERETALLAKAALESRCAQLEVALQKCEATSHLMAEKAHIAEEEAKLHEEQAHQYGEELERCLNEYSNVIKWSRYTPSDPHLADSHLHLLQATGGAPPPQYPGPTHPLDHASYPSSTGTAPPPPPPPIVARRALFDYRGLPSHLEQFGGVNGQQRVANSVECLTSGLDYHQQQQRSLQSSQQPLDGCTTGTTGTGLSTASSVQHLAAEMSRERARFGHLQAEFSRQLRETWSQLAALKADSQLHPDPLHRLLHSPALPGSLDRLPPDPVRPHHPAAAMVTYSPQLGLSARYPTTASTVTASMATDGRPPAVSACVVMTKFPSAQQVWSSGLAPSAVGNTNGGQRQAEE